MCNQVFLDADERGLGFHSVSPIMLDGFHYNKNVPIDTLTVAPDAVEESFRHLHDIALQYRAAEDVTRIEEAFRFAEARHHDQKRKSGEPFMLHPLAVATLLAEMRMDLVSIQTGLLHDTVEDTKTTTDEI